MPVALQRELVLVIVSAHPVDRAVVAALDVVGDDDARLLGAGLTQRDRGEVPGEAVPKHDVASLLVREHQLTLETLRGTGEEVRAEALVVGARRNDVLAL